MSVDKIVPGRLRRSRFEGEINWTARGSHLYSYFCFGKFRARSVEGGMELILIVPESVVILPQVLKDMRECEEYIRNNANGLIAIYNYSRNKHRCACNWGYED